ncbi:MAG: ceramide glucosyltransferase, partial [Paraburkholderia sp.]|nr:ceramide glucosyltransferase [Paraburkholderia sp.]
MVTTVMTSLVSDWLLVLLCCAAAAYAAVAAFVLPSARTPWQRERRGKARREPLEAVSVLKPLCGAEPRLFENLSTFCEQTHPCYQLLFGVSLPNDPAIGVVRRLQAAYPQRDIELVVDPLVHGQNLKVSNLINL